MDTVSPSIGVKPIIDEVNGIIKSDGTTAVSYTHLNSRDIL